MENLSDVSVQGQRHRFLHGNGHVWRHDREKKERMSDRRVSVGNDDVNQRGNATEDEDAAQN